MRRIPGLLVLLVGVAGLYGTYRGWARHRASAPELVAVFAFSLALICAALPAAAGRNAIDALVQNNRWVRAAYAGGSFSLALACGALAWNRWGLNLATLGWLLASAPFAIGTAVIIFLDYGRALGLPGGQAGQSPFTSSHSSRS